MRILLQRAALVAVAAWLAGCAASEPLPATITNVPVGNVQLVEVMRDVQGAAEAGVFVRWGGTVVDLADEGGGITRVEVLERKLQAGGRPTTHGASDGRFVIRAAPEVDPWRYRIGSEVTVAGTVEGAVTLASGEPAPVLRVTDFVRWQEPLPPYRPYPWYYDDPLWGPGPWYYNRWYPHYPRHHLHYGVGVGF
ncbi:MAG: Slp family lipoprotein [Planctomycetes bacterium]|nr:Slp family lipoprotein [Planctomycetota bacterium]